MKFHEAPHVRLLLPAAALTEIFDECDRFDDDETGGRILGTFTAQGDQLTLRVSGVIEPGPKATRSRVSFFQDGKHQEQVFRKIERSHPEIEHLGNWHTHHMNGLSHLSDGDISTYSRIVNHQKHNIPFFYAFLVIAKRNTKDPLNRYSIKHYIFRRGDDRVYEIPPTAVEIVDAPLVWPIDKPNALGNAQDARSPSNGAHAGRVFDRDFIAEYFSGIRAFSSNKLGIYWRGPLVLVDDSEVEILLVENTSEGSPAYSFVMRNPPQPMKTVAEHLAAQEFPSARAALIAAERACNRVLHKHRDRPE